VTLSGLKQAKTDQNSFSMPKSIGLVVGFDHFRFQPEIVFCVSIYFHLLLKIRASGVNTNLHFILTH